MTIAAGFVHADGVLLCSDTQMEGGMTKIQAPKIGMFTCSAGKLGFAFAGNTAFAISAIQKCYVHVKDVPSEQLVGSLQEIIEQEYRRSVFEHPSHGVDANLAYSLLISFWDSAQRRVSLFQTQDHVLYSCYGSECIGIGFELANVLMRPFFADTLSEEDALILAAYTLAQVKNNVPGCGGESMYVSMRHDGTVTPVMDLVVDQIEDVASRYHKATLELLFAMGKDDTAPLDAALKDFGSKSKELSAIWKDRRAKVAAPQYLRLTKDGPIPEPPSPESRAAHYHFI